MRRIIVAIFGLTQSGKTLLTQELEKPLANQGFMSLYASQLCRRYIQDNLTRPFWKKCSDFMARNRPLPSAALRFIWESVVIRDLRVVMEGVPRNTFTINAIEKQPGGYLMIYCLALPGKSNRVVCGLCGKLKISEVCGCGSTEFVDRVEDYTGRIEMERGIFSQRSFLSMFARWAAEDRMLVLDPHSIQERVSQSISWIDAKSR